MTKRCVAISIAFLLVCFGIFATGNSEQAGANNASDKVYTIKIGYVQNESDPLTQGLYYMAEQVKEKTDGKVQIQVMPNGVLGDTGDVLEQCRTGAPIGLLVDAGRFIGYIPEIGILDAPYLFDTYEQGNKIVQSSLFTDWFTQLEDEGFKILSFNWYQGSRNYLTTTPVNSLADAKNLKIRTGGSKVWQATINSFGSKATSLAQNDVYSAIQGKVVDGCEQQVTAVYGLNLVEVAKYYALTNHFQLLTGLCVSNTWFNSLPSEYQEIFKEEAIKAGEYASSITINNVNSMLDELKAKGLVITELKDLDAWKAASESVYKENAGFEDLRSQIKQML